MAGEDAEEGASQHGHLTICRFGSSSLFAGFPATISESKPLAELHQFVVNGARNDHLQFAMSANGGKVRPSAGSTVAVGAHRPGIQLGSALGFLRPLRKATFPADTLRSGLAARCH